MLPNAIIPVRLKLGRALHIDGSRPRRYSADPARTAWYAARRSARFARRLNRRIAEHITAQ